MTYPPGTALAELTTQHEELRRRMDRCELLADELDAGHPVPHLADEVAQLRLAFERHNAYEERLLRPLLAESDPFASARIDRMIADHVDEHRHVGTRLSSLQTATLRDVIETLRAHLDAEERYLLSSRVLGDGVPR